MCRAEITYRSNQYNHFAKEQNFDREIYIKIVHPIVTNGGP